MPLAQLPLDCEIHVVSDWFEFYVLNSDYRCASFRDVQRMWDRRRNAENTTPDGLPDGLNDESPAADGDEQFIEYLLTEIRQRIEFLGDAYPFEFSSSGGALCVKKDLQVGHCLYLFCLLLSNAKNAEVFELDKFAYELTNVVRDLFQACATWAAATVTNGSAISFGFPRPDGSNFVDKLRQVYALFGEGEVRNEPLPGVSTNPKDAGIDVIAWSHRKDNGAGKYYVVGQVATGQNWPGKSVVEYLRPFHEDWFSIIPASKAAAAIFIPQCLPITSTETLRERINILTKRYGHVYYRYVIPTLAIEAFSLSEINPHCVVDRIDDLEKIRDWVSSTIVDMRQVA